MKTTQTDRPKNLIDLMSAEMDPGPQGRLSLSPMSAEMDPGPQGRLKLESMNSETVPGPQGRLNLDPEGVKNGLGQLVLTVVKLLHELLERQALRRMEKGSLTEREIEALGTTLMKQAEEIDRLRREFGLEEEDLNLDLGPLGRLL